MINNVCFCLHITIQKSENKKEVLLLDNEFTSM